MCVYVCVGVGVCVCVGGGSTEPPGPPPPPPNPPMGSKAVFLLLPFLFVYSRFLFYDLFSAKYCFVLSFYILKPLLRTQAYSNILKILQQKKEKISQIKNSDVFHIPAQNIDCGTR